MTYFELSFAGLQFAHRVLNVVPAHDCIPLEYAASAQDAKPSIPASCKVLYSMAKEDTLHNINQELLASGFKAKDGQKWWMSTARKEQPLALIPHTRDCALECYASGFGLVTNDQKFLKFDAVGNAKIVAALKASDKKDRLRVNVNGTCRAIR